MDTIDLNGSMPASAPATLNVSNSDPTDNFPVTIGVRTYDTTASNVGLNTINFAPNSVASGSMITGDMSKIHGAGWSFLVSDDLNHAYGEFGGCDNMYVVQRDSIHPQFWDNIVRLIPDRTGLAQSGIQHEDTAAPSAAIIALAAVKNWIIEEA